MNRLYFTMGWVDHEGIHHPFFTTPRETFEGQYNRNLQFLMQRVDSLIAENKRLKAENESNKKADIIQ